MRNKNRLTSGDGYGAVVTFDAADSKQSADLTFNVRRRRTGPMKAVRVAESNPVSSRHRGNEQHNGDQGRRQTRHQQPGINVNQHATVLSLPD